MELREIDLLWIVLCAGLVFTMQAGFLCLESGLTRSKNAISVSIKNLIDFALVMLLFWAFGFAWMFGLSAGGLIGTSGFFAEVGHDAPMSFAAFFLFQAMFCATASTIVSGAVAERMRFAAYLVTTAVIGGLIYPVFGHWAWGGLLGGDKGWLASLGFVDFAGSTVVHSVGGWVALAAVLVLGARTDRFDADGRPQSIPSGNLPIAMLGVLILAFGWFGFNGGSTLAFNRQVPGVLVNTAIAGAAGAIGGLLYGWHRKGHADVLSAMNGTIAGLVAITAGAHAVPVHAAVLIGLVGAYVMAHASHWLLRRRIDDAVDAIPAHLAAGAWGTIAVGLFGELEVLGTGLSRLEQVGVQALGVAACGAWSFGVAWCVLRAVDRRIRLRVTAEDETLGLNVSEHGARTELIELLDTMSTQARTGDLKMRVATEPFTEVGQIGTIYNRVMEKLEQAVERTRAIVRDVREGVVTLSGDGTLTSLNPGAESMFRTPAAQMVGRHVVDVMLHLGVPDVQRAWTMLRAGERFELKVAPRGRTQQVLEVSVSRSVVGDEEQLTAMFRDVTERKQVEAQLHRERDLAQVTLASIGDAVVTTDEGGTVRFLNPVAERLTGWSSAQAVDQPANIVIRLVDEAGGQPLENPVRAVLRSGTAAQHRDHVLLLRRDGERVPVQYTAAPIRSRDGYIIGAVLVLHDVTVALSLARELSHQASHDALTGLPNRREFERRLQALIDRPRPVQERHVLGYLDLDQFKVVNDTCGHVAGDELLRQVTGLLRQRIRGTDLIARLGGDEFGLIFHGCTLEKAMDIAEAFRAAVEEFRFAWEGNTFGIGVSIGLVPIEPDDRVLVDLLSAADSACYAAKEAGRNRVHLFRRDDAQLREQQGQLQWVSRIQAALDEDRLRLWVQPILPIGPDAGLEPHHEILLRLEENGELVSPGAFLPAAERYNLMPRIDQWVIANTLGWLGDRMRTDGRIVGTYCVNLSGASLSDERFREALHEQLAQMRLPPGALCLEITETAAVANLSKVVPFIESVRALGCTFALDDFGSGLSSFGYLKTLPVDYLKIDGAFVRDIERDPIDLAMVQSINAIGHVMGLKTIAEFVENAEILEKLREIGVDYAQGWHLGRPVPLESTAPARRMPR